MPSATSTNKQSKIRCETWVEVDFYIYWADDPMVLRFFYKIAQTLMIELKFMLNLEKDVLFNERFSIANMLKYN